MDLHIVPGITAKAAAEAHLKDLLLQEKYHCNCMTYWVDEANDRAFCLIEAPDADTVKELHSKAHGLMTHQIIEVNTRLVELFLGRIFDPETAETIENNLKLINDPAFRCLVFIRLYEPALIGIQMGEDHYLRNLQKYRKSMIFFCGNLEGTIVDHNEENVSVVSFKSSLKAVEFASQFLDSIPENEQNITGIKISISQGMPVTQSDQLFGETIELGERLLWLHHQKRIILSSGLREITSNNLSNKNRNHIYISSTYEEQLLSRTMNILDANFHDEHFEVKVFCRSMAVSKSTLNRRIANLTGRTPNSLIREFRLRKAFLTLRKDPSNISQAAFTCGFGSPSYFTKCFKEFFHISPSLLASYIKKNRKG